MIYIRLFHGRIDPNQDMDDWGSDGPVFGPYEFVHTTYTRHVRLGKPNDDCDELFLYEDMLHYDGVYYGDWSIFDDKCLQENKYSLTPFNQQKNALPKRTTETSSIQSKNRETPKRSRSNMKDFITFTLNHTDVAQILDGLEQRQLIWHATAEYLALGYTDLSDCVEDCADPREAQAIADYYQYLITTIKKQRDSQISQ